MMQYVGLDVSMRETKLHVLDEAGQRVWRGRCATEPAAIAAAVRRYAPAAVRIGLETGPLTTWLWTALTAEGLPMVCLDARHAKRALDMKVNKTDANDAEGLAHLVRAGWYREVRVKGRSAMLTKALLGARSQLLGISLALENQIRGFEDVRPDRTKGSRWTIRKARSCPDNRRQRDRRGHHATPSSTTSGTQQLRRT
jgi:transposase